MATKTGITTGYNITALSRINGTPTRTSFTTSRLESNLSGDNTAEVSIDIDESTIEYGTITSITINYSTRSSNTFWSAPTPRTGYINNSGGYTWVRDHYCESAKVNDNPKPFNDTITNPTRSNNGHYRFLLGGVNEIPAAYLAWIEFTSISLNITYTPHTHNWTSTGKTNPTCTAAGSESFKCSICGATKTETIPAKGHTPGAAATCTTPQKCTVCGATMANALGHSFGSTTYTWSADGKSCTAQRVCSRDSSHKETSTATITSAVKTAATCLAKGTTTYTAKFSVSWATTQTKDVQDIAQKSHSYTGAIKSNGNGKTGTHSFQCVNGCGNYGGAVTHTWNSGVVTTQPTCTAEGVKTFTCTASGCGATYTEKVAKIAHTEVTIPAVAPTCESTGLTAGKKCSVCGTIITAQQTIAALGHNYVGEVTKQPTCTEKGVKTYTCQNDSSHKYTEEIPAKGHTEVTLPAVAATCTATGLTEGKKCSVCNTILVAQQTVPALGHDYSKIEVVPPTDTTRGYTKHTCSRCGDSYTDSYTYKVTFKSESGATLKTATVNHGSTVTAPETPVKADTAQWKYTFDGWYDANGNKWTSSTAITSNTVYTAQYSSVAQKYTIRWYNYDGSPLETDTDVPYGTKPDYNGATPTKPGNAEHSYQFAGWDYDTENGITPALGTVYIDITAQFTEIDNTYTVKWVNEGNVIETDTLVPYGAKPDYNGATPTKASDAQYDYTFIGWSTSVTEPAKPESELETVKGNVTYTAVYSATTKLYPIRFILFDTDDTVVLEYGIDITFEAPAVIGYKFVKWNDGNTDNPRTVEVTGEATYQAIYERIPIPFKVNLERVTGVYAVPSTKTIVYVISGTVPTVETKADTVDDWNFLVSNTVPENSYPLEKVIVNGTRLY